MNHGRLPTRLPRAPVMTQPGICVSATTTTSWIDAHVGPFRIGPAVLRTAHEWHECGIQAEQEGDVSGAIDAYRMSLQIGGSNAMIIFDLAYALATVGESAAAIERYRQVIELDPTRHDAWNNLGDLLMDGGNHTAAIEAFEHALRLTPDDAAAHYNLADALDATEPARAVYHWQVFLNLANSPVEHVRHARTRLNRY